jgi:hypothetical protein
VFRSVEKFPRYYAGQVANLESSNPEVSFGVVDLIHIGHEAPSTAGAANPEKLPLFYENLVFHDLLALQARIVENETFCSRQFFRPTLKSLHAA